MRKLTGNWIALLVFTAIAVYLSWLIIAPFIEVIIWSAVLAVVSYPVYLRWRKRGRGPAVAAFLTTTFVVLVIVVPLALVGTMLVKQVPQAINSVQEGFHSLLDPNSRAFRFIDEKIYDLDQLRDRQYIAEKVQQFTSLVAGRTVNIVGGLLGTIVQMFFVLFTLYYMLKDADRIVPAIRDALPLERSQAEEVFARSREIISASLNGVLVISAIQGILGGIAFAFLGLPSPVMWGVVMFLFSMIPMAGAAIVWAPAAIYLFATGNIAKGVILVIWG
ncbi:MAG TPA: AI-2E family transporter, partial [Tepidisphaeraceae bacterium]|nr:AI-2E family transporter [Tepidisphaeraceae bacterium]